MLKFLQTSHHRLWYVYRHVLANQLQRLCKPPCLSHISKKTITKYNNNRIIKISWIIQKHFCNIWRQNLFGFDTNTYRKLSPCKSTVPSAMQQNQNRSLSSTSVNMKRVQIQLNILRCIVVCIPWKWVVISLSLQISEICVFWKEKQFIIIRKCFAKLTK